MFRSVIPQKNDLKNDRRWQWWRNTVLLMAIGGGLYLRPDLLLAQTSTTLINRGEASYQDGDSNTINVLTNEVEVTYTPEVRAGFDLGIDLSLVGDLTTGQTGTYQAVIVNEGTDSVNQFVFVPTNFEAVLGENPTVSLISIVDGSGTAVDTTNATLTQQSDGSWLLQGVTIAPGTVVTLNITGIVPTLTEAFDLVVEVRSPRGEDGVTPVFVDSNPDNNQDQAVTPFLVVVRRDPICDGDAPYFEYEVATVNSANDRLTMTWLNPNGEDFVYTDLPLSGRVLWPGAVVSPTGEALDWPGWRLENGVWIEGDEWDWVRPDVQVNLSVNPESTITVAYPPATPVCSTNPPGVVSSEVDLGIDLSRTSDLVVGTTGTYQAVITSSDTSATVNEFVVVLGNFENILGNNPQVSLAGAVDSNGNVLDISTAIVTQQSDGSWLIQGLTIAPGTQVSLNITGTVQPLIADVDFQVDVEVRSPLLADGVTPAFVDSNPDNNFDLQPEQLTVDLGIDIEPVGAIVPGTTGSFTVEIEHNGRGAVNEFIIRPTGFEDIFVDGNYTVSVTRAGGTIFDLTPDQVQLTRRDDGTWYIQILGEDFFLTGQTIEITIAGVVTDQIASNQFSAQVEIQAPIQSNGLPLFVDTNPDNNVDQTSEVLNTDLSLDILDPGLLVPGTTSGYTIEISNNGPGTIGRFLVTPTGFENVVGDNPQLSLLNLTDSSGNPVDLTGSSITVQPNGQWLITGVTLTPGSSVQIQVTGIIEPLVSDVVFQVEGIVSSPLQENGTPDFLDTNPNNNQDQEPQQLQVDLGIVLEPTTDLVPGQAGAYGITLTNNGPGAVNEFQLSLVGFDTIFTDFVLPPGSYGVNSQGELILADGTPLSVPISLVSLTDTDGVTPVDLTQVQVTIDDQGQLAIGGFTFIPGQIIEFQVDGIIQNQIADTQLQAQVQVQAPLGVNGQPLFTDTDPSNDIDDDLKAVDVDLAIQLLVDGNGDEQFGDFTTEQLVSGQPGAYQVQVTNNAGSGSVDRLIIVPTGFNEVFTDFTLIPGNYRVNSAGQILTLAGEFAGLPIQLTGVTDVELSQVTLTILEDGSLQFSGFAFDPGDELTLIVRGTVSQFTTDTFNAAFSATVQVQSPCIQFNEDGSCGVFLFQDTNPDNDRDQLIDPLGRVVGCDGNPFSSYQGFTVALFDALDNTGTLASLTALQAPGSDQIIQLAPGVVNVNPNNDNPFDLGQTDSLAPALRGQYNFLFTDQQATVGRQYVLILTPPPGQSLSERRLLITVTARTGTNFSYTVNPLDGLPISIDDQTAVAQELSVAQADRNFLVLPATTTLVCQNVALSIQKVADRATAAPGDIVIYRITVRNLSTTTVDNVIVTDRLPLGFVLEDDSIQAQLGNEVIEVTSQVTNGLVQFRFDRPLPGGDPPSSNPSLSLIYATEITPDALRGRGRNFALVTGGRTDNDLDVTGGPAIATVELRNGLISDYATLIGRVFVDKNFDGEQQEGEPGVPNAVIFLQNGNRVETDKDGLFSVANILPGWYVGTLDLSSVPGYTIAPNAFVLEKESQSRMVRVEPGGMARMNFAITPVQETPEEVQP